MNKDKPRSFRLLGLLIIAVGMLAIIAVCIIKFMPTRERISPEVYFGLQESGTQETGDDSTISGGTVAAVIVKDHIAQEKAYILDGSAYIDYTLVQREINSRFHWDASAGLLLFTNAEQIYEIPPNSSSYTVDGESFDAGYEILKTTTSGMFLSANFMQQNSDVSCNIFEAPSRVVVCFGNEEIVTGTVKKNTTVRVLGGIKSPIITDVTEGTVVTVLEQMENWSEIVTPDGYIGYMKNNCLKDVQESVTESFYQGPDYTSIHQEGLVNLVWHQIDYPEMNAQLEEDIAGASGLNVISPTWYFLSDDTGNIQSFADASYVERAHAAGLQVWALISNFSPDVSTRALLSSRAARNKVQEYLVSQAKELGFDGINIDFEGIVQEAGYDYVQFMRELSILCRKNQIVLSVDVPVPMDFSAHYNRKELGVVCDYVIVMGYDEHYAGSDLVGSVASMSFERTGIENMLREVPKEKLISGIPFYARLWYTKTMEDGTTEVTSEALSMNGAAQVVSENGAVTSFDESTGQQYAEWTDADGRLCQIWLEDEESIRERVKLVGTYNLAGNAAWVLGNEKEGIWNVIQDELNG